MVNAITEDARGRLWVGTNGGVPAGFNFVLPHSVPDGPRIQSNWRFCGSCHGMFFNGPNRNNHRCPAGGLHDPQGFPFALPHGA